MLKRIPDSQNKERTKLWSQGNFTAGIRLPEKAFLGEKRSSKEPHQGVQAQRLKPGRPLAPWGIQTAMFIGPEVYRARALGRCLPLWFPHHCAVLQVLDGILRLSFPRKNIRRQWERAAIPPLRAGAGSLSGFSPHIIEVRWGKNCANGAFSGAKWILQAR